MRARLLLIGLFILSVGFVRTPHADAATFPDVPTSHPYYTAITELANRNIVQGYGDGRFGPNDAVQRAQMAAFIARAEGWDGENHGTPFSDRGGLDPNLWRNVGTLAHYGVAKGYGDGTFHPVEPVLGAQVISLIVRAQVAKGHWTFRTDNPARYPNVPASAGHRVDLVTYVAYVGAIPGTSQNASWGAWDDPASRGWVAQALWQAIAGTAPPPEPSQPPAPSNPPAVSCSGAVIVGAGGYATIGAAVAAAPAGATICVRAGTYNEQVALGKPLTLVAYGDGPAWIDGGCSRANGVRITAADAAVRGLGIRNTTDAGVRIDGAQADRATVDGVTIHDFNCRGTLPEYGAGVAVWYAGGARITNNAIAYRAGVTGVGARGRGDGIWFKSNSATPSGGGHYVAGNTIVGGWDGIGGEAEDDSRGLYDGNTTIEGNRISWCDDDGIQVEGNTQGVVARGNTIAQCNIGIANAPNRGDSTIEGNTIVGASPGYYGNLSCFKLGDGGAGTTTYRNNSCDVSAGGGGGFAQTNAGLATIVATGNRIVTGRYVIEFSGTPAAGSRFDGNCFHTTDPGRFIKWGNQTYGSLAAFRTATGQEQNGSQSATCATP